MSTVSEGAKPKESIQQIFTLADYQGGTARWCPGCGDHGVLLAVQKICAQEQLPPHKTVFVSGIGCSSRLPHYMKTYGFHGLHGRAMPVACGVKGRRPDLHVFVASGDGDFLSIGAGHWVHGVRYNMNMTLMVFDNGIYGLTKAQTSPTSPTGLKTKTHPSGALLPPLNPIQSTLGLTNLSFLAQTVDWKPQHLKDTIHEAFRHPGLGIVRIMQRCTAYTADLHDDWRKNADRILLMKHDKGVPVDPKVDKAYKNQIEHDPSNMAAARELADRTDVLPIGLFYKNPDAPRYDHMSTYGMQMSNEDKLAGFNSAMDKFGVR
jgi:2-oxoglutarate ferredoxin oxidoreductase subunit beta